MEHMRMDPKHQFAAQYVLSRAAAERRDRESFLAASLASGSGLLSINTSNTGGAGQNSMCASPSAQSDVSSNNERLSSAGSDVGVGLLNNNNNNNCNNKLSVNDVLRASGNNGHLHNQYGVDEMHANRMAVMAAAANIVNQSQTGGNGPNSLASSQADSSAAAVQAAVVNLAAAMRMNQVANQNLNNGNTGNTGTGNSSSPPINTDAATAAAQAMLRVSMADSMMSMNHQSHHQHQQNTPEAAIRMQQQAEAILRTQAEALRLVSQAAAVAASTNGNNQNTHHNGGNYNNQNNQSNQQMTNQQPNQQHTNNPPQSGTPQNQLNSQVSPELSEALRLHEQRLQEALRLQGNDPRSLGFPLTSQTSQHNP